MGSLYCIISHLQLSRSNLYKLSRPHYIHLFRMRNTDFCDRAWKKIAIHDFIPCIQSNSIEMFALANQAQTQTQDRCCLFIPASRAATRRDNNNKKPINLNVFILFYLIFCTQKGFNWISCMSFVFSPLETNWALLSALISLASVLRDYMFERARARCSSAGWQMVYLDVNQFDFDFRTQTSDEHATVGNRFDRSAMEQRSEQRMAKYWWMKCVNEIGE